MKALNSKLLVLAAGAVLALTACGKNNPSSASASGLSSAQQSSASGLSTEPSAQPSSSDTKAPYSSIPFTPATGDTYKRADDEAVFERVLGKFLYDYDGAKSITNDSKRFVAYARAEASLLESGTLAITTTHGGSYSLNRIAPRTAPYVFFGNDSDKLKYHVLTAGQDSYIKASERAEMIELWKAAKEGGAAYDPAAYLTGKGYTLATEIKQTFQTPNATFDPLSTSMQADTEQMVNCIEGLVQYDTFGNLVPCMAQEWESNADNTKFVFKIRNNAYWYNVDRRPVAKVTADDFVAGFQHMLDAAGGLEWLVEGVVKGVEEYLAGTADFDDVGCYVDESGNLVFELEAPESFFVTRLAYSCFLPMNRAFFFGKGGDFGADYDPTAETYQYGKTMNDALYNSAFIPTTWDATTSGGSMVITKNENYWDAANVKVTKATWVYDDGTNPTALYNASRQGDFPSIGLSASTGLLQKAKDDGLFNDYAYVTETDATTFFGGLNINRGAFANPNGSCASNKNEAGKILTWNAMQSQNFRRALFHGWDRGAWNAVTYGEDLKYACLRNMYTQPEFVSLSEDVEYNGTTFGVGLSYGDVVQKFLELDGETAIKVQDGIDGWYNPTAANSFMAAARQELAAVWPADTKIQIDMVVNISDANKALANAYKQIMERQFPNDIVVNLIQADNTTDYHSAGYRAKTGADEAQDIFYGSGWGPDYGDPSTYLDTFAPGGYMLKVLGLF